MVGRPLVSSRSATAPALYPFASSRMTGYQRLVH